MNYYEEIKNELINNEVNKRVKNYSINRSELNTNYNVGRMLRDAGKHYGVGIIKQYAKRLTNDLGKGYTETRLKYYRRFYDVFSKGPTLSDKLSYSHYCEIIWFDEIKMSYYIKIAISEKLSVRKLRERIKTNEYERLPDNTKNKLVNNEETNVIDYIKNPIHIKNSKNLEVVSEKVLQSLIMEDLSSFLKELGTGFTFIENEYPIKVGDRYNYIDILLYNIKFKCYVVVELQVTEVNSKHTGQIQNYMNYIDRNVKSFDDNKTVGIIICKRDNKYVIDYCSDERIVAREYELL